MREIIKHKNIMIISINNKSNIFGLLIFIIILFSCNGIEYKKQYYGNGVLKEKKGYLKEELKELFKYDSIGNIIESIYFTHNKKDSLLTFDRLGKRKIKRIYKENKAYEQDYYDTGVIRSQGEVISDSLAANWWDFYDSLGKLKARRHYIVDCGQSILNQSIIFDKKGDTVFRNDDYNESTFYDFKVTNLNNGKFKVDYKIIPVSNRSKLRVFSINKDNFCDLTAEDVDTVINLSSRTGTFIFKSNEHNIGIIEDFRTLFTDEELKEEGITENKHLKREMYFDLDDYVVKNMDK